MKKIVSLAIVSVIAIMAFAVPAKRGWQTRIQADGTPIEVQQMGDEFYHYFINREGKQVREIDGQFQVVGEAPTPDVAKARRAKAAVRRQRKDIGVDPNLAPKGVVILANFSDSKMKSAHTQAVFDELCNAENCTVNNGYPSAAQYFADQSHGAYRPVFDVFGPVDLSRDVSYYGKDNPGQDEGDDQHATDAVVEACILANQQYTINWADYDSNNDGKVDFVYVIYAGKGQADGGSTNTIWPHNWEVTQAIQYGYCTYTSAQRTLGGKQINNYAMSSELSGNSLGGIGTLCHEFGHVMGMPDFYDTSYGTNYESLITPNEWDVMDGGAYNGDGHCPPNYSPWEKYFFGWVTPVNLGNEGASLTLYPNGTEQYNTYQINASGTLQKATKDGLSYYIECRQKKGWDINVPAAGMLIWKVNFSASAWKNNTPNNTANNPKYTLVIPSGTKIGASYGAKNVWPYGSGSSLKNSWEGVSGKPLKDIAKSGNNITLIYIEDPVQPIDPFDVQWFSDGKIFETNQCSELGKVVVPEATPSGCNDRVFIGWCADASYASATTAPKLVKDGDDVEEGAKFYAIFADVEGEGGGEAAFDGHNGGTFKICADVNGTKYYATATVSNSKVQSTTSEASAADFVLTPVTGGFTIQTGGKYLSNGSKTNVSLSTTAYTWAIENGTHGTWRVNSSNNAGRALAFRAGDYNIFGAYSTSNINGTEYFDLEIGGKGGASYSNYSTSAGCAPEGIEDIEAAKPAAVKVIREGRIVIIRGEEEFTVTGERIR